MRRLYRPPLTEREHAFTTLLVALRRRSGCGAVREVAAWGLAHWLAPQAGRDVLLADSEDADGRLAAIRLGVLERLARLAPPDRVPHAGLLAVGNPTVGGWLAAVRVAAAQAVDPVGWREGAPAAAPRYGAPEGGDVDRRVVADLVARASDVRATSPAEVVLDGGAAAIGITMEGADDPDFAPGRQPFLHVSCADHAGRPVQGGWWLAAAEWRAWSALVCGLYAVDRLALPEEHAATLRACLTEPLGHLLAGTRAAPEVAALAVGQLDDAPPAHGAARPVPRWRPPSWPAAHAAVLRAIDRLVAGDPRVAPERRPEIGTWVEVLPEAPSPAPVGGPVVAEPPLAMFGARRRRPAGAGDALVWVRVGGVDTPVPLRRIRVPRPCALFR